MSDRLMAGKVLARAAEIVDGGWCQGTFTRPRGVMGSDWVSISMLKDAQPGVDEFCLSGAIGKAGMEILGLRWNEVYQAPEVLEATDRIWDHLRATTGVPTGISQWNDVAGRTKEQVWAALQTVARQGI